MYSTTRKLRLSLLAFALIWSGQVSAESVCFEETETNDHFETLDVRYTRFSDGSIRINVSVGEIDDSVQVHSQVYYGLQPESPVLPELDEGFEIRVDLLPEFNEDSIHYEFELGHDFSRLMIQVSSARTTEHAMSTCGIWYVLSVSHEDIQSDSKFGKLGPAKRADPIY